ncbi:MAG: amidohydrolase [Pseudomonadales bacterium]|nr:amidohydrolase [Pseudomonadales bacterium]
MKPCISADSHIIEPPHCYTEFIEPKYRAIAPRIEKNDKGVDCFRVEGMDNRLSLGFLAGAGVSTADFARQRALNFDQLPRACWNPLDRLAIQDEEDITAEIIYASIGMVLCGLEDYNYKAACFTAYNRWLETFCGAAPTRLYGLAQTAVNSIDETIKDFRRAKQMGMVGMMMTGNPRYEDYDHPDYDALWECAVDLDMPVAFHILTMKGHDVASAFKPARGPAGLGFLNIIRGVQDIMGVFVFGGVFERHPKLKMVIAEGDAGWVPHYMYRADHGAERLGGQSSLFSKPPSHYVRDNVWFTFQDDQTAYQNPTMLDNNKLLWASDYPHTDSTYPNSQNILSEQMAHLTETQKNAVVHDNVLGAFTLAGAC